MDRQIAEPFESYPFCEPAQWQHPTRVRELFESEDFEP